jgi:hypothetical protein
MDFAFTMIDADGDFRIRTSTELLSEQDDASFLSKSDERKRTEISRLPSWVPNWAQPRLNAPMPGDYECDEPHLFAASAGLQAKWGFAQPTERRVVELQTRGILLGLVSTVGEDFYGRHASVMIMQAWNLAIAASKLRIPAGQSIQEAFYRTLTFDRTVQGDLLPDSINYRIQSATCASAVLVRSIQCSITGKFMILDNRMIGLGPRAADPDDGVFLIPGCHVPIVLREHTMIVNVNVACVDHNLTRCAERGCTPGTKSIVVDRWWKVIGGACE